MHHRNWAAPIALPRNAPIAQSIIDFRLAKPVSLQPLNDLLNRAVDIETVEKFRIYQYAVIDIGFVADLERFGIPIRRADHAPGSRKSLRCHIP